MSELQKLCLVQNSLLGALKRSLAAAGRVLPSVCCGLEERGASQSSALPGQPPSHPRGSPDLRKGPGAAFLTAWAQSGMCTQISFPWLLAVQPRGRMGGMHGPSLLFCFLADLGSVPSPPCFSVPICTEQPGPGCTISPALCASGRMRSCKVMLSSPSPKLRVDFHLLRPLSSSVPSPPSFPCSVTLMGQAGPSQPG